MAWSIDKSRARFIGLSGSAQLKWDEFQNAIYHRGEHPKDVAERLGGKTDYKLLGTQFQIRLSHAERATFLVHDKEHRVEVLQVGGHT